MLLKSSFRALVLRLTKTQAELDGALLYAALANRRTYALALIEAGADIHAASDHALRTAANMGYFELFSSLLEKYDPKFNLPLLNDIRIMVRHLSNREQFVDLLSSVICDANVVKFAQKRPSHISPVAAYQ
jgi:hypothetical protein